MDTDTLWGALFWDLFGDREGLVCLAKLEFDQAGEEVPGSFKQQFFQWPSDGGYIAAFINRWTDKGAVYFCPTLMTQQSRRIEDAAALPGTALWADFDKGLPDLSPEPTYLFETSPGRYHSYWLLEKEWDSPVIERHNYSQLQHYKDHHPDPKFRVNDLLRVPGTLNLRKDLQRGPLRFEVKLASRTGARYRLHDFDHMTQLEPPTKGGTPEDYTDRIQRLEDDLNLPEHCRKVDRRKLRRDRILGAINSLKAKPVGDDRSGENYRAVCMLLEFGLPLAAVMEIAAELPSGLDKYGTRVDEDIYRILTVQAPKHASHIGTYETCVDRRCRAAPEYLKDHPEEHPEYQAPKRPSPFVWLSSVEERPLELLAGTYPIGELTIVSGNADIGKSTHTHTNIVNMMNGLPLLNGQAPPPEPIRPLILSKEDEADKILRPRYRLWGANLDVHDVAVFSWELDEDGLFTITDENSIAELEEAIRDMDRNFLLVDPIADWIGSKVDNYNNAKLRSALSPLRRLIRVCNLVAVGVEHFNKNRGETNPMHRVSGSHGLVDLSRSAFVYLREPHEDNITLVSHEKKNYHPRRLPTERFSIESCPEDPTHPVCVPQGFSGLTGEEVLEKQAAAPPPAVAPPLIHAHKLDEAKEFLSTMLSGGPVLTKHVQGSAAEAGIRPDTLNRASKELNVVKRPPAAGETGWTWVLPPTEVPSES